MFNTPILFILFNRPDTTQRVFDAIKAIKPKKLYVTADGPRKGNKNDLENCPKTREIIKVDWDCEVIILYRDENLGCRNAVSNAITWFFNQEEKGIILEDDCLPDLSFFPYCAELLEKYENNEQIMLISGNNFQNGKKHGDASYYFSRYNHIWGWASWRRVWQNYDVDMKSFPEKKKDDFLKSIFPKSKARKYWLNRFERAYRGEINTWDYQWTYTIFSHNGISILPNVNLISNIGFGNQSTHTAKLNNKMANLPTTHLTFPLIHPNTIEINNEADDYTFKTIFSPSLYKKALTYLASKW